jgi:hypothetical protein
LIVAELDAYLSIGLPVLMAGDLTATHIAWNSRLTTTRGESLRDHSDGKSCLNFGPDSPTTNPYNHSATPDVLDIVITRNLPSSVADFLLYTKLGPPHCTNRHWVSLILSTTTGAT